MTGEMMISRTSFLLVAVLLTQGCMTPIHLIPFEIVNKTQSDIRVLYAFSSSYPEKINFGMIVDRTIPSGRAYRFGINGSGFDEVLNGNIIFGVVCGVGKMVTLDGSSLKRKVVEVSREIGATYYIENCNGHKND